VNAAILPARHDTVQQQVSGRFRNDERTRRHGERPLPAAPGRGRRWSRGVAIRVDPPLARRRRESYAPPPYRRGASRDRNADVAAAL